MLARHMHVWFAVAKTSIVKIPVLQNVRNSVWIKQCHNDEDEDILCLSTKHFIHLPRFMYNSEVLNFDYQISA